MFQQMMDIFHRARTNQALTAPERASLKAIQGFFMGFIVSLLPQIPALSTGLVHFNFSLSAVVSLATAFALYIVKLYGASGDTTLAPLLDAYSTALRDNAVKALLVPGPDGSVTMPVVHIVLPAATAFAVNSSVPVQGVDPTPVQNPPQGVSGAIPYEQAILAPPTIESTTTVPTPSSETYANLVMQAESAPPIAAPSLAALVAPLAGPIVSPLTGIPTKKAAVKKAPPTAPLDPPSDTPPII